MPATSFQLHDSLVLHFLLLFNAWQFVDSPPEIIGWFEGLEKGCAPVKLAEQLSVVSFHKHDFSFGLEGIEVYYQVDDKINYQMERLSNF